MLFRSEDVLRCQGKGIRLLTAEGEPVFCGKCMDVSLVKESQYAEVEITAGTMSVEIDKEPRTAIFQAEEKKLGDVLAVGGGKNAFVLDTDLVVPEMLYQKQETAWAFGRRLANQYRKQLFVNGKSSKCQIHVGVLPFGKKEVGKILSGSVCRNVDKVREIRGNTDSKASVFEFEENILIVCDLTIGVGYAVDFEGRMQIVTESRITCSDGLIQNKITLANIEGIFPSAAEEQENKMKASILEGKVLEVEKANIKVDFGAPGDTPRWIPFAGGTSNHLYCMPDAGDRVIVYYETGDSSKVVCIGSRHVNDSPDFGRYQDKMLTANNRMVKFGSSTLNLIGNRSEFDGSGDRQAKIIFNEEMGVEIQSTQDVTVRSVGGDITIQAVSGRYAGTDRIRVKSAAMHQAGNAQYLAMAGFGALFNMGSYLMPDHWMKLKSEVDGHVGARSGNDGEICLLGIKKAVFVTGSTSVAFFDGTIQIKSDFFQQVGTDRSMSFGPVMSKEYSVEEMKETTEISESGSDSLDVRTKNREGTKEVDVDAAQCALDIAGALPIVPPSDTAGLEKAGISFGEKDSARAAHQAAAAVLSVIPGGQPD